MTLHNRVTRRFCTKCNEITSWKLDRSIGHSRCIRCHSTSKYARKPKKTTLEEPKLNKQYVREQIDAAVKEIREEYNKRFENIYQCPDCGAVAFKNSEHICFKGLQQETVIVSQQKKKTIGEYVLEILLKTPPEIDAIIESDSIYTSQGISTAVISAGYQGSKNAIASALSDMFKQKKINRRAATIKVMTTSKSNKKFEKEATGFVYWRKE